jgi:hypothetical protein
MRSPVTRVLLLASTTSSTAGTSIELLVVLVLVIVVVLVQYHYSAAVVRRVVVVVVVQASFSVILCDVDRRVHFIHSPPPLLQLRSSIALHQALQYARKRIVFVCGGTRALGRS